MQNVKDKILLHSFARDLTRFIFSDEFNVQKDLVALLEEGVIDISQATLIYEIFHERILSNQKESVFLYNDVWIINDSFPVTWFLLMLCVLTTYGVGRVLWDLREHLANIYMFSAPFFCYCVTMYFDRNGWDYVAPAFYLMLMPYVYLNICTIL
jgi:hypothetical protein